MTHLTLDFSMCSPLSQGLGIKVTPKSVPRSRPSWQPLWDSPGKLHWRTLNTLAHRLPNLIPPSQDSRVRIGPKIRAQAHRRPTRREQAACKECRLTNSQMEMGEPSAAVAEVPAALTSRGRGGSSGAGLLLRFRRQLKWDSFDKSQEGRTTTVPGFIDWGPTGTDSNDEDGKVEANTTQTTRVSSTTVATTTSTTVFERTFTVATTPEPRRLSTTTVSSGETVKPKPYGETQGKHFGIFKNVLEIPVHVLQVSPVEAVVLLFDAHTHFGHLLHQKKTQMISFIANATF